MVDYANDTGIKTVILGTILVLILFFLILYLQIRIGFSYFSYNFGQLCSDMATPI